MSRQELTELMKTPDDSAIRHCRRGALEVDAFDELETVGDDDERMPPVAPCRHKGAAEFAERTSAQLGMPAVARPILKIADGELIYAIDLPRLEQRLIRPQIAGLPEPAEIMTGIVKHAVAG